MKPIVQVSLGILALVALFFHSFLLSCIVALLLLAVFSTGIPCVLFVIVWTILYTPSDFWSLRAELIGGALLLAVITYIIRVRFLPKNSLHI
jgi:hypothetical protein